MDNAIGSADSPSLVPRKRILFVTSDSPEVADLRAGFDDMSQKWIVEFVFAANQALSRLDHEHFDAAVIDLLIPGIDGAQLLKDIMVRSPDTLRLGMTTASERQAIQHVNAPAHQFLSKPCDPKVIKAVLARAFASQNFLSHEHFRTLVSGIQSLPVLPQLYTELMQELKSEEPSLEKAGQIVARDMGLTTKILQLVNSAFFGLGQPMSHPSEAAVFLGTETVQALVLSLQVFAQFNHLKLREFNVENLWKHSWATGVLARRLCEFEEADRRTTDEAFIAGLLHDVGKLVLAANYPYKLDEAIRQARQNDITLWEQEYRIYGASHAELGGYVLGLWGLPAGVVEAVAFHHRPAQARRQAFSALTALHAANTLGKQSPSTCGLVHQAVDADYLRSLGLSERIERWKQFLAESLEKQG